MFPVIYYSRKGRKNNPFFSKVFGKIIFPGCFAFCDCGICGRIVFSTRGRDPECGLCSGLKCRYSFRQKNVQKEWRSRDMDGGYGVEWEGFRRENVSYNSSPRFSLRKENLLEYSAFSIFEISYPQDCKIVIAFFSEFFSEQRSGRSARINRRFPFSVHSDSRSCRLENSRFQVLPKWGNNRDDFL